VNGGYFFTKVSRIGGLRKTITFRKYDVKTRFQVRKPDGMLVFEKASPPTRGLIALAAYRQRASSSRVRVVLADRFTPEPPPVAGQDVLCLQLDLASALHYDPLSTWRSKWVLSAFRN
ncbi:MAG: hypothetical protein ACRD2L_08640, partial [Terriglobia bacterium]